MPCVAGGPGRLHEGQSVLYGVEQGCVPYDHQVICDILGIADTVNEGKHTTDNEAAFTYNISMSPPHDPIRRWDSTWLIHMAGPDSHTQHQVGHMFEPQTEWMGWTRYAS